MEALAERMRVRSRMDECGDRMIAGKRGDVHRGTLDGVSGYYLSLMYPSARKFHIELKKCEATGGQLTQEGDTEAVLFFPHDVALANCATLRTAIKAKRIKQISPEAANAGAERLRRYRETLSKRASSAPAIV